MIVHPFPHYAWDIEPVDQPVDLYSATFLKGRWELVSTLESSKTAQTITETYNLGTSQATVDLLGKELTASMKKSFTALLDK